jgi:hypothetical protein
MHSFVGICLLSALVSASTQGGKHKPMNLDEMLNSVQNDRIQFATQRPPGSKSALLERRVVITGPPELVELTKIGDAQILTHLINLLKDPSRAWAAEVLLAALTGREEKLVDSFASERGKWWEAVGQTAYERWSSWLDQSRSKLVWDSKEKVFVEQK